MDKNITKAESDQIFNSMVNGMAIIGKDFNVLRINRAYLSLLGISEQEAVHQKCYNVLKGSLCHTPECPVRKILDNEGMFEPGNTGSLFEAEVEKTVSGDTKLPFLLTVTPLQTSDGELIGAIQELKNIKDLRQSEESLRQSYEKLQKAMNGTVEAMAVMVETRDPYTAGHQRRVAQIAKEIAVRMNLPEDQIHGVWVAASVHDIGKIYVPSEFLSKPGQLTDLELEVIKTHSAVGHRILEKVEFPWPVAEIVIQHHERMDGSGYPSGLSGENILLEARIIGVADVVEAMSSHRPYRPALGMNKALEELKHKANRYDAQVVRAYLDVYKHK
ncbi:HD domain-containing phosphohydrolase [Desulfobacterales bacterium HSG2]|nr:HD domain-containing phosphohydrolase [Desulfobacterales bacterium HSG2]